MKKFIHNQKGIKLEDIKKIKKFRKYYRKLEKLIIEIEKDKILIKNEKGKLVGCHLGAAKGYCKNQIKFIENKYQQEENT